MAQSLLHCRRQPPLPGCIRLCIGAALLACVAGCLYTDPINMPPQVKITQTTAGWRNQAATFIAEVSDPNGDAIPGLQWGHNTVCPLGSEASPSPCVPCPVGANEYLNSRYWPTALVGQQSYTVDKSETLRPFCVWAFAADIWGAQRVAIPLPVMPLNHPPVADMRIVKPTLRTGVVALPLYSEIELSGDPSNDADADPVTFTWNLINQPMNSSPALRAGAGHCSDPTTSSSWCFVPDMKGSYTVSLQVNDEYVTPGPAVTTLASSAITRDIEVADDRLPCLSMVLPEGAVRSGLNPAEDQVFAVVRVDDDGDPYPTETSASHPSVGMLHFRWFKGVESGPLEYVGNDVAQFTVHRLDYSPTDRVVVRVEIFDRKPDRVQQILDSCGDRDICGVPIGQSACNQRMTWRIEYR